jgi:hypothetical protein
MAISTFYPENLETLHPFFFPEIFLYNCNPSFLFFVAKWQNYAIKTNADHNFGEEKREKRKKDTPDFDTYKRVFCEKKGPSLPDFQKERKRKRKMPDFYDRFQQLAKI